MIYDRKNSESIYFFVFMGLHKHYLFQTKDQAEAMTKLFSLVVLYKGDTAAHILKVLAPGSWLLAVLPNRTMFILSLL